MGAAGGLISEWRLVGEDVYLQGYVNALILALPDVASNGKWEGEIVKELKQADELE